MNQPLKQLKADVLPFETYLIPLEDDWAKYFQADTASEAMAQCIQYLQGTDDRDGQLMVYHIPVDGPVVDVSFDVAEAMWKQSIPAWGHDNYWFDTDDIHGFIIAHIPDIEARKEDAIEDYL